MEEFILIRPTSAYASQIAEYRQEFLDAGDSRIEESIYREIREKYETVVI